MYIIQVIHNIFKLKKLLNPKTILLTIVLTDLFFYIFEWESISLYISLCRYFTLAFIQLIVTNCFKAKKMTIYSHETMLHLNAIHFCSIPLVRLILFG